MVDIARGIAMALALSLLGCGGVPEDTAEISKGRSGLSRTRTQPGDPQMEAAIQKARETLPVFLRAFRAPGQGQADFAVKKEYVRGLNVEHIWLTDLRVQGQVFSGVSGNDATDTVGVRIGDPATVAFSDISDWMYTDKELLVGGTTIRVIYDRMSDEQKVRFREDAPYRIE